MITPNFKKFDIEAYKPGKSKVKKLKTVIKLSANESALGMSPKAKKIISNKKLNLDKYPDGKSQNLRKAISKAHTNVNQIKLFVEQVLTKLFK
jgi:histidinol-phosphate aminotransferase